jgi:hypothetical protein
MLHNLTIGHMDTTLVAERGSRVWKPLDDRIVTRHLTALGERNEGDRRLGDGKVEFRNGCVIVPWLGGRPNRAAEEFALRMIRDTGCQVIDREHGRVIDPGQLAGLTGSGDGPFFAGARRVLKAMGLLALHL